jgi:SNF2 family DNA or RNA helicase
MPSLRPYQVEGALWLRGAFTDPYARVRLLCDEMGLGKTPQTVMALPGSMHGDPDPRVIILAPPGLHTVWRRHIETWRPDLRCTVISKTKDLRAPTYGEAVVISPDALGYAHAEVSRSSSLAGAGFVALRCGVNEHPERLVWIVDEAHRIKGAKARRSQAVSSLISPTVQRGATCWALTATPAPRDALDLWCLVHWIGGGRHPHAWNGQGIAGWASWARAKMGSSRGKWTMQGPPALPIDAPEVLGRIYLRRLVKDHLGEIPPPVHRVHVVHLDPDLRSEFDGIFHAACKAIGMRPAEVESDSTDAAEADAKLKRLMGAMENMKRGELSAISAKLAAAKAPHVMDLLEGEVEDGNAVIVYSQNVASINLMRERFGYPVIVGGMDGKKKSDAADKFQGGETPAIGFTSAGSEGITLTRANVFIEADQGWSVDERYQALARAVRYGQGASVLVIHVLADHPLEMLKQRVLERKLKFKRATQGSSL